MPESSCWLDLDFASGLPAYYAKREAYYRQIADTHRSKWQLYSELANKYRVLGKDAAAAEELAA